MHDPVVVQREYYARTANEYDRMHVSATDEHAFALAILVSIIDFLEIRSVLDIGSGTGRALLALRRNHSGLQVVGIEPSPELRAQGYRKGLTSQELVDGDAQALLFQDDSFDLVCEFGALHHIQNPRKAVSEMLRVARKAIFISDSNNFGQGGVASRCIKQIINAFGLWPVANLIKTRGRGYTISDGDGLAYSYSIFNDYDAITACCERIHFVNTVASGPNLYRSAPHLAVLGLKSLGPPVKEVVPLV
jgi:ubiquinone/menaquinone biosynthesis C-methylase UbiE